MSGFFPLNRGVSGRGALQSVTPEGFILQGLFFTTWVDDRFFRFLSPGIIPFSLGKILLLLTMARRGGSFLLAPFTDLLLRVLALRRFFVGLFLLNSILRNVPAKVSLGLSSRSGILALP